MASPDREFLAAVAGYPGHPGYAGHWEHDRNEDTFIAARDELLELGMELDRVVALLAGLYAAGKGEVHMPYDDGKATP